MMVCSHSRNEKNFYTVEIRIANIKKRGILYPLVPCARLGMSLCREMYILVF